MSVTTPDPRTYAGRPVDHGPDSFGSLTSSSDLLHDLTALRQRFAEDGYLYLPGLLNRDEVLAARRSMLERLQEGKMIEPGSELMDGIVAEDQEAAFMPALAKDNPAVTKVLYDGPMMAFYEAFFGEPVRHFDYTWVRCKSGGGKPTVPHYDITYMGRGSKRLMTSWTPMGDVPFEMGGLMILEHSHRHEELKATYGQYDVDKVCTNREDGQPPKHWSGSFGAYDDDAFAVQEELGGRFLSAEYKAGDLLVFSMYTMHCSLDNHTNRFRLSTDSRYQPAADPVDERWIGEDPPAHGPRAKRDMIC